MMWPGQAMCRRGWRVSNSDEEADPSVQCEGNPPSITCSSPAEHRMRTALGAAILLALIGNVAPAAAAAARYVKVVHVAPGHVLWLHSGPGRHFQRIGFLPYRARQIRAYRCKALVTGSWCQVRHLGTRGWASKRFLAKDSARFVKALAPDQRDSDADSLEEQTSELLSPVGARSVVVTTKTVTSPNNARSF
jgi:uncharacterized protein YraI